eukprot:scaffold4344_cov114-Isochrysis_galbana.AAC.3
MTRQPGALQRLVRGAAIHERPRLPHPGVRRRPRRRRPAGTRGAASALRGCACACPELAT